jgi:hypothetical protein
LAAENHHCFCHITSLNFLPKKIGRLAPDSRPT